MDFLDRVGLAHPVVQAGMGGGVAGGELAGAVSAAGALGTIGIMPPSLLRAQLGQARERANGHPVAANLLMPFTRAAHVRACVEAGGHLMGDQPLHTLLPRVRQLGDFPILAAGGIADFHDAAAVLDAGANAAVAGTRFLLTSESRAHPAYKQRVRTATETVRTMLFGVGWPLEHRVVPNAATKRWSGPNGELPAWLRRVERASAPLGHILPLRASGVMASMQHTRMPLFGPALPLAGMPDSLIETTALYAGETVRVIDDVISAREAVARLTH
jgi:nitronate monooxygenase